MESMAEGGAARPDGRRGWQTGGGLAGALLAAEQLVAGLQQGVGGVGTAG